MLTSSQIAREEVSKLSEKPIIMPDKKMIRDQNSAHGYVFLIVFNLLLSPESFRVLFSRSGHFENLFKTGFFNRFFQCNLINKCNVLI